MANADDIGYFTRIVSITNKEQGVDINLREAVGQGIELQKTVLQVLAASHDALANSECLNHLEFCIKTDKIKNMEKIKSQKTLVLNLAREA